MNILIIGGAGFVGGNIAVRLANDNHNVTVMDNLVRRGSEFNIERLKTYNVKFVHGDSRNKEDFNNIVNKIDIVLDCAAQPSAINYSNPDFDITNNTFAVLNVLNFCKNNNAGLIFWSTNKCYTGEICNKPKYIKNNNRYVFDKTDSKFDGFDPENGFNEQLTPNGKDHSIYGVSKIMADLMIQEYSDAYNIPSICNRFSCLAGSYQWGKAEQGWMAWFAIANILRLPITIYGYDGYQVRDYLFIDDLYNLIVKQINNLNCYHGEVFNVGGGINYNTSILETINYIENTYHKFVKIDYDNIQRRADQRIYISDISKVKKHFNWEPTISLEKGYVDIYNWIYENENIISTLYS